MTSSSEIAAILGVTAVILMCSYATYWALEIRRGMAVRLYRNQALGTALVAMAIILVQVGLTLTYLFGAPGEVQYALPVVAASTIYYWTDASVRAARRVDPLLRDTLGWSKLRLALFALIFVGLIYAAFNIAYDLLNGITGPPSGPIFLLVVAPIIVPLITAAVVLPVVGSRSKDNALRRHLLWFGLFAAFVLAITIILSNVLYPDSLSQGLVVQDLGVVLGGYCLYRSAKSLAPLNRLSDPGDAV